MTETLTLVQEAREHGDLFHTRGNGEQARPYYPDLTDEIRDAWARTR